MRPPRVTLLLALLIHASSAHAWAAGWLEIIDFIVEYFSYIAVAAEIAYSAYSQSEANRKAKNAYNDSLTDRTITARGATENRRMVLGRQRVGGVVAYIASTGVNKEKMVMVIALAAHECDGIEAIYFNDIPVTFPSGDVPYLSNATGGDDSVSVVTTTPFSTANLSSISDSFIGDGTTVTFTLLQTPGGPGVWAAQPGGAGQDGDTVIGVVGTSGTSVTLASAPTGPFYITYQASVLTSYARIHAFLGGPGQTVDSVVQSLFPSGAGNWDSTHAMAGCAGVVVIFDYNEDAFQTEVQVSAIMRGAKCYDPRLDSTAGGTGPHRVTDPSTWTWSENPAVLIGYAAMSPLCGRQPASAIRWDDLAAAANVCDTQVDYSTWGQLTDEDGNFLTDEDGNPLGG